MSTTILDCPDLVELLRRASKDPVELREMVEYLEGVTPTKMREVMIDTLLHVAKEKQDAKMPVC